MAHQHGSRHGADAAGDGGDGLHHRLCLAKADVTAEFAFLVDMDAHIHDDLTGPQMLCADKAILPMATTTTSASRQTSGRFRVRELQRVTVAFSRSSIMAAGLPTTRLRPTTTARLPERGML